ncbi:MAG: DUF6782 family putative metallopeptidase [Alphaproteobacteria bacterium]
MGLKTEWQRLTWSLMSEKKKQKLLDDACRLLQLWPETSLLLDLAQAQGVGIRFDDSLESTDTDGFLYRNRTTNECYIALKPCREPRDIAIPLIHELRHLWQEKELGLTPATSGLAEPDARMALIFTRVKEADAFAFTDLMIARINHAQEDLKEQQSLQQKMLAEAPSGTLPPQQQEELDDFIAARISARIADEKTKMTENFLKQLGTLDSYDAIAANDYFRRYVSATGSSLKHLTAKDGQIIGLKEIRALLKTGTVDIMPPYFDAPDDKAFSDAVLSGVKPAVLEAVSAMEAFEKAATRAPHSAEARHLQDEALVRLQKLRLP